MAKPLTKRRDETELQFLSRKARHDAYERDRNEPIVPLIAQDNGSYVHDFVTHVETNTKAKTFRRKGRLPVAVQNWVAKKVPGFEAPAILAILHCLELWEARPLLGKMCASYEPVIPGGANSAGIGVLQGLDRHDELSTYQSLFHRAHWAVFEAVVRYDRPVGEAALDLENNAPQSTACARTIVGLVANVIAMKMGA